MARLGDLQVRYVCTYDRGAAYAGIVYTGTWCLVPFFAERHRRNIFESRKSKAGAVVYRNTVLVIYRRLVGRITLSHKSISIFFERQRNSIMNKYNSSSNNIDYDDDDDYMVYDEYDYDDFELTNCRYGGGGGSKKANATSEKMNKRRKQRGGGGKGNIYSSKHIRAREALLEKKKSEQKSIEEEKVLDIEAWNLWR